MTAVGNSLGKYLEAARKEARLSIRQLAIVSNVQPTIIVRLLQNQMVQPKPEYLVRLADALELRASDLFLLAGLRAPDDLPSVEALLRTEYDLPETAIAEAKQSIEAIVARYTAHTTKGKEEPNGNHQHH